MMAVAPAPLGVAMSFTIISNSGPVRRLSEDRTAALSDKWACSFTTHNCYSRAVSRSGQLSNALRTDESFGAAISKSRHMQQPSNSLICSTLDGSVGSSDSASITTFRTRGRNRRRSKRGFECCASSVADLGSVALAMEWRPAVDQVMLVTSVALAYFAGIVTPKTPASPSRPFGLTLPLSGRLLDDRQTVGQQSERVPEVKDLGTEILEADPWDVAQAKLGVALSRLSVWEKDAGYHERKDKGVRNPVLSLQALGTGPRLRLLVLALEHLHTQVDLINESNKSLPAAEWSKLTLDVLCGSVEPICRLWLSQEPSLLNTEQQLFTLVKERRIVTLKEPLKTSISSADSSPEQSSNITSRARILVLDYLQRSGKTELHTDLLFFLRFQTVRPGGCCDYTAMSRHVSNALEDLVVALADGAAAIYLGRDPLIGGLDSDWPIFVRPSIKSTRALERFRNEIALQCWFQSNFTSVVAMFEDRFELWAFERHSSMEGATQVGSQQLKKNESFEELRFKRIEFPARRGKELRALTGWRYIYSLYLEFSDVMGPLLAIFAKKFGEAVSFLLVRLIGRSLGLIFEGIRQSVRWTSK